MISQLVIERSFVGSGCEPKTLCSLRFDRNHSCSRRCPLEAAASVPEFDDDRTSRLHVLLD